MPFTKDRPIQKCTVCESPANFLVHTLEQDVVDCSRCGDFTVLRAAIDDFLPLHDAKQRALASYLIRKLQGKTRPTLTVDFFKSLPQRSLPTPIEANDNLLLLIAERADGRPGRRVRVEDVSVALIGVIEALDLVWAFRALKSANLVEGDLYTGGGFDAFLTTSGWRRVEELKRAHISSRFAFFARKFDNPDLDRVFEECLRPAVAATGYDLRPVTQRAGLVDAIIEDEMRRCRFLIADLSDDNAGAYWEAGLAEGLGKPVIYVCREKEGTEEKKTHFDANHRHTVRWDLSKLEQTAIKLKAVIRNTLLGDTKQDNG
jgi:hypothetical protein